MRHPKAVSYTHLDVYKRQVLMRSHAHEVLACFTFPTLFMQNFKLPTTNSALPISSTLIAPPVSLMYLSRCFAASARRFPAPLPLLNARFFTNHSSLWQQEVKPTPAAVTAQMLRIIPNDADLVTLEKQDALIKRRRKLSKEITKLKKLKPVSPGLRWYRAPIYPYLHKGRPIRSLTVAKRSTGGRNHTGRITVRHRGGGHKRRIRMVDFTRFTPGEQTVQRIEYDPGRSAHIALLKHSATGELSYIPVSYTHLDVYKRQECNFAVRLDQSPDQETESSKGHQSGLHREQVTNLVRMHVHERQLANPENEETHELVRGRIGAANVVRDCLLYTSRRR